MTGQHRPSGLHDHVGWADGYLDRLADALGEDGWRACMVSTGNAAPLLLVANPEAPGRLRDYLGCARDEDGRECYWWAAHAIKVTGVEDLTGAVKKIQQRLARTVGEVDQSDHHVRG